MTCCAPAARELREPAAEGMTCVGAPPPAPPLPARGAHPECFCHTSPRVWQDKPLKPIVEALDCPHPDPRAELLRRPPPGDTALETRGSANQGGMEQVTGGGATLA